MTTLNNTTTNLNNTTAALELEALLGSISLSSVVNSDKASKAAEKAAEGDKELLNRLKKVGGLITAYQAYNNLLGASVYAANTVLKAMVTSCGYLNAVNKETNTRYNRIVRNYLVKVVEADSKSVKLYDEATALLSGYTVNINQWTPAGVVDVHTLPSEKGINGYITTTGINISLEKGTTVNIGGKELTAEHKVSRTLNASTFNKTFIQSIMSVRIHNEYKYTDRKIGKQYEVEETRIAKDAVKASEGNFLSTYLLLAGQEIDISTLISARNNGRPLGLVLKYTLDHKIERVANPAHSMYSVYGLTGIMSAKEAALGLVAPTINIANLSQKVEDVVYMVEAPAKVAARVGKNNSDKWLWTRPNTVVRLIVGDVHCSDKQLRLNLNAALAGGAGFSGNKFELANGPVRVVSESAQGMIKSAVSTATMIPNNYDFDGIVVGMDAFKGGALGALNLLGKNISMEDMVRLSKEPEKAEAILLNMVNSAKKVFKLADGIECDVLEFEVDLKITNSYAIDSLLAVRDKSLTLENKKAKLTRNLELIEQACETGSVAYNSLRNEVIELIKAEQAGGKIFSMLEWVKDSLTSGKAEYKEDVTRIISSEIQSMAHWYGDDVAVSFVRQLNQQAIDLGLPSTQFIAADYLTQDYNVVASVAASEVSALFRDADLNPIPVQSVHFKRFEELDTLLGGKMKEKGNWIEVDFGDTSIYLPTGFDLVNDAYERLAEIHAEDLEYGNIVMKGLIYEMIQACHYRKPAELKAKLQEHILGKALGYMRTVGFYGMNAPLLTKPRGHIACVNHDRIATLRLEDGEKVAIATEAPAHFYGANSCFIIGEADVGKFAPLYRRVSFVNPLDTLYLGNDFDGDTTRFSKGITKSAECITTQFNGDFFNNRVVQAIKGNEFKVKFPKQYTFAEVHAAIHDASVSGEKVGIYTTNSYHFERLLPTLVAQTEKDSIITRTGQEITLSAKDAYQICAILKQMLQVEAMDGMKHIKGKGALAISKTVTEDLLIWNLSRNEEFGTMSADEVYGRNVTKAHGALSLYNNINGNPLSEVEITLYAEAMVHVADNYYSAEYMMVSSTFDNKAVGEKFLKTHYNPEHVGYNHYDFEGQLHTMLSKGDKHSIYNSLLANLVNNVNDAREVSE